MQGPALDLRLLVIAFLPHIKKLNGTIVSAREKQQADIFYLKYFALDYHSNQPGFAELHPRYKELVEEYGEPAKAASKISTIKDQTVSVTVVKGENSITLKLIKTTPIKNLQVMIQRKLKVPLRKQNLVYYEDKDLKVKLDDMSRDLEYYGIISDATVYLD